MSTRDGAGQTILVVEDDPITREGLTVILERAGYRVVAAKDGREALAHLRAKPPPGLMLLDLMLPVEDGWLLLDRRRRELALAAVPVVLVTAFGDGDPDWATPFDVAGYLVKPVDVNALLAEVRRCCAQKPV
jgi:DNA-binding response OmpR family regulator